MSKETHEHRADNEFYIVDVRAEFSRNPYITLWRPGNAGYAYPLPWAGRYTRNQIENRPGYYHKKRHGHVRTLDRYPVPCAIVERFGVDPDKGLVDGNVGPVLPNTAEVRSALQKAHFTPPTQVKAEDDPIFLALMPTGWWWTDRTREEHGDYAKLAFLSFSKLELEIFKGCPADLKKRIENEAANFQSMKGQDYRISTTGQTIRLGHALKD